MLKALYKTTNLNMKRSRHISTINITHIAHHIYTSPIHRHFVPHIQLVVSLAHM